MTGKELIQWIHDNHAEDLVLLRFDNPYMYHVYPKIWLVDGDGEKDKFAVGFETDENGKPAIVF